MQIEHIVSETKELEKEIELPHSIHWNMTSKNGDWNTQLDRLAKAARSEFPILLLGPSGAGKDVLAQNTHNFSTRRQAPFVCVNCSTLTESLIESELFGHVRGAYTGALADRKGAFESARGGTLFLDEIGDLPQPLQAKLLRALENNEIRPVGSDKVVKTNVRIIAATHQNLHAKIQNGLFRADLYYRLNVIRIHVPALRNRLEDFESLLLHFCRLYRVSFGSDAVTLLKTYDWPGNIRELKNVVARACALFPNQEVSEYMLLPLLDLNPSTQLADTTSKVSQFEKYIFDQTTVKELEQKVIRAKLKIYNGNQRRTAMALGIPKSTLNDRIRMYGIDCRLFKSKVVKQFIGITSP